MFICITNLYNYTCTMHIGISSSIQLIQMFICITNIKKYNVKISDRIACRNVLFTNNLKKNKHTWLCKTPVPIYPVIEPIDTTFYIVLRGNIWLRRALEPMDNLSRSGEYFCSTPWNTQFARIRKSYLFYFKSIYTKN